MFKVILAIATVLSVLVCTPVAAQEVNGCVDIDKNNGSVFDVPFVPTGTPLLSRFGFDLSHGRDNHIKSIIVWPGLPPGMMRLDFSDDNPFAHLTSNDDYCFNVTHFGIIDFRIRHVIRGVDVCDQPQCTVQLDRPAGDFVFVLIGFHFQFHEHDNHIKQIAISENNGQLTVAFHDRKCDSGADDTFIWSVQYAYVPQDRFSQVGQLSGTRARDTVIETIPVGKAVLRGFSFTYQPFFTSGDDHHLKQISVRPNQGGAFSWSSKTSLIQEMMDLIGSINGPFLRPRGGSPAIRQPN
jgi:hypothetical protein